MHESDYDGCDDLVNIAESGSDCSQDDILPLADESSTSLTQQLDHLPAEQFRSQRVRRAAKPVRFQD